MDDNTLTQILDFIDFKGCLQPECLFKIILNLDREAADCQFTENVISSLLQSLREEYKDDEEDIKHFKTEMIKFINNL